MVLLADQHGKRSCLAGASTCFWTQCTEYLQQVTQSAVSAGTLYRRLYHFSTVLGKRLTVKTGTCRSGGSSDSRDATLLAQSTFSALALSLLFIVSIIHCLYYSLSLSSSVDICRQTFARRFCFVFLNSVVCLSYCHEFCRSNFHCRRSLSCILSLSSLHIPAMVYCYPPKEIKEKKK